MGPPQRRSAPAHAGACAQLSWHDRVPTGHGVLPGYVYFSGTLRKRIKCIGTKKGTIKEKKTYSLGCRQSLPQYQTHPVELLGRCDFPAYDLEPGVSRHCHQGNPGTDALIAGRTLKDRVTCILAIMLPSSPSSSSWSNSSPDTSLIGPFVRLRSRSRRAWNERFGVSSSSEVLSSSSSSRASPKVSSLS